MSKALAPLCPLRHGRMEQLPNLVSDYLNKDEDAAFFEFRCLLCSVRILRPLPAAPMLLLTYKPENATPF